MHLLNGLKIDLKSYQAKIILQETQKQKRAKLTKDPKGGRKECQKDPIFKKMEGDLQNLVPAIGEINGDRSNYRYAQAPKNLVFNQYGNCQVYTDFKNKRFYPADYSKGWIARSYLYMSKTYNIRLSNQERKLMESWDRMYPMSEAERLIRSFNQH